MTRTFFGCIAFSNALLSLFLVLVSTSVTAQEQCGTSVIAPNRGYTAWLGTNVVGVYAASSSEGGLKAKLAPIVDRILSDACDSYSYTWDSPFNGGYQFACTIDGGPADGADSVSSVDVPGIGDPGGVYCPGGYAADWYFDEELGHEVVGCGLKNRSLQSCSTAPSPDRERGKPSCGRGNPCDVGSGNKYQAETDFAGVGGSALVFKRYYNSDLETPAAELGMYWRDHYDRKLLFSTDPSFEAYHDGPESIFAQRADGRVIQFLVSGSTFIPKYADTRERLALTGSNTWTLTTAENEVETYKLVGGGAAGSFGRLESIRLVQGDTLTLTYATDNLIKLNKVSDAFGHALTFTYNSATGRLATMKDPANNTHTYQYNGAGYLSTVIYPDTTPANQTDNPRRKYNYADATNSGALTSLVDENNSTFAAWTYDADRRAISSQHAGGVQRIDIVYDTGNTATVTHVGGQTESFEFDLIGRSNKPTSIDGGTVDRSIEYDSNGYPERIVDARGVERLTSHDSRGLETSRTEASGTASERTVSTQWHATFRLPLLVSEPNRSTAFTYDANGNLLTRIVTDLISSVSRVWTYTYDGHNRVLTQNGPRTDVNDTTTYTYYTCTTGTKCGRVQTITNALNQVTTFNTYNAHGQPLTVTDPNGVVTTLTYDVRTRLTSTTRAGELTTLAYHPTGLLQRITLPDSSYVQYTYDSAHRLTSIADGSGNHVDYTLDLAGNRTAENAYDPSNALARTRSRVYNSLNQLWKDLPAAGTSAQTTIFGYDGDGNVTDIDAPLVRSTDQVFDELGRLAQMTDPALGQTLFGYDAHNNLTSVTDPKGLATSYEYSGFDELTQQISPDTGTTLMTYDSAGNLATQLDARGEPGTYSYDAINRVTHAVYGDQTLGFTYDGGTNGKGHLTQVSDASGTTSWTFTTAGRVASRTQSMGGVTKALSYGYTSGRLTSLTLPSGQVINYTYVNGRISSIRLGAGTTIVNNILYEPLGPVRQWSWGNGSLAVRTHNLDGLVTQIDSAGLRTYSYDDALRVTGITDVANSSLSQSYGYDALDRLTSATGTSLSQGWTFDANSSRLSQTGTAASSYSVSAISNQLTGVGGALTRTYTYDASGNVLSDGSTTFTYNDAGRMSSATKAGTTTTYAFNALGQRVRKSAGGSSTYFVYDEDGRLIGEYGNAGALIQETVWFDATPVATLRPNGSGVDVFYVHPDHLNTPRRVSRASDDVIVWRWDGDPFGTTSANSDPDGDSTQFVYNARFPGQYFDVETGLHYNYFRDGYDPVVGRYTQADPLGLVGGINQYGYVGAKPITHIDPWGLREYADSDPFVGPLRPEDYYSSEMTKSKCGRIPPAPPWADINGNMRDAEKRWNPVWFRDQVRNKGPWDYKQFGSRYRDFGNFNFGATGIAFGFSLERLLREAGRAQQQAGTSRPGWGEPGWLGNPWGGEPPYGDDPDDQKQVSDGAKFCECMSK